MLPLRVRTTALFSKPVIVTWCWSLILTRNLVSTPLSLTMFNSMRIITITIDSSNSNNSEALLKMMKTKQEFTKTWTNRQSSRGIQINFKECKICQTLTPDSWRMNSCLIMKVVASVDFWWRVSRVLTSRYPYKSWKSQSSKGHQATKIIFIFPSAIRYMSLHNINIYSHLLNLLTLTQKKDLNFTKKRRKNQRHHWCPLSRTNKCPL